MIELTEQEKNDLLSCYVSYEIVEDEIIQPDWVTRKFPSSGRLIRCVEKEGGAVIKQLHDHHGRIM
jgi:hypothetical protein